MPWVEYSDRPPLRYSNLEGFTGIRLFKVHGGVDPNTILTTPDLVLDDNGNGMPKYDTPWPGGDEWATTATLETYDITFEGADVMQVRAVYTDRRFRGEYGSSFQTEVENVMYSYVHPLISGSGSGFARGWSVDTFAMNATYYRIRKTKYVTLPDSNLDPLEMLDSKIHPQVNNLHRLLGENETAVWARFEGADTQKLTYDRYRITYAWVIDTGIKYNTDPVADIINVEVGGQPLSTRDDLKFPEFTSRLFGTSNWFRPPFETVRMFRKVWDQNNQYDPELAMKPPIFYTVQRHPVVPDGHTLLP